MEKEGVGAWEMCYSPGVLCFGWREHRWDIVRLAFLWTSISSVLRNNSIFAIHLDGNAAVW